MDSVNCGLMTIKSDSATPTGNKTEFEGIISSTRLDSQHEQFGVDALKEMAKRANRGVKVLTEHNAMGQPIGRSLSAEYNPKEETVTARFYIQKGLNLRFGVNAGGYADSDSYIAAAQEGTTDGLSVGAIVKKETCNHCGAAMKRFSFFGMTFIMDKNNHYPGQVIYLDKDEKEHREYKEGLTKKLITATIDEAELMEFSLVAFGANPDAEITEELQKAFKNGELTEAHLDQLNDRFAIKVHDNRLIGGLPPMIGGHTMSSTNPEPQDDKTTQTPEPAADPTPEPAPAFEDKSLVKELQSDLADKELTISTLEAENDKLKIYEERSVELEGQLKAKDEEIAKLNAMKIHTDAKVVKIQKYDALCENARDWSVKQFVRCQGTALRAGEENAFRSRVEKMDDYEQIMEWGNLYRSRSVDRDNRRTKVKSTPESILERDDIHPELYV